MVSYFMKSVHNMFDLFNYVVVHLYPPEFVTDYDLLNLQLML